MKVINLHQEEKQFVLGDHSLLSNGGALVRHQLQEMLELLHACLDDAHENV